MCPFENDQKLELVSNSIKIFKKINILGYEKAE
jgi:hypothetical protein